MSAGAYLAGLGWFAGTWGGAACTAALLERRRLPRLEPLPRALALALLFLGALVAAHVLPGMVGLLTPAGATVTSLGMAALASRVPWSARAREHAPQPDPPGGGGRISRALGAIAVLGGCAFAIAALAKLRMEPPEHVDAVSFGLPGVAAWITSGSIWHTGAFLPFIQVRTYPNNGDVVYLAAILPWHSDAFIRLVPLGLLGLTGLGVAGIARELRARAGTAALLGVAVVATKVVAEPALSELKPDIFMYATFAGGVLFLLRHVRTGAGTDLALAALGLGLAFGSRWYGLSSVVLVVFVWALALLLARRRPLAVLRDTALLSGGVLLSGGFWLLRNLVLTGNPIYPVKIALGGLTILDAPRDVITEKYGYTVAGRLGQPGFISGHLLPDLRTALGLTGALVVAGSLLALVLALRGEGGRRCARQLAVVGAGALVALSWLFLPGSAQGVAASPEPPDIIVGTARWLLPALLLGAGATAWAASRLRRAAWPVDAALLVCVLVALPIAFDVLAKHVVAAAAGLVVVGFLARSARGRWTAGRLRAGAAAAPVAASVAVLAGLAVAGYAHERSYTRQRPAVLARQSAAIAWVDAHAPADRRIGVAGSWSANAFVPIYGLFGPRLGNDVSYVGPIVDAQLREYGDARSFDRALATGRYQLLAVGTLRRPNLEHVGPEQTVAEPPEARWARSAGWTEVARDPAFILLARPAAA